jgi:hypothetical protein
MGMKKSEELAEGVSRCCVLITWGRSLEDALGGAGT